MASTVSLSLISVLYMEAVGIAPVVSLGVGLIRIDVCPISVSTITMALAIVKPVSLDIHLVLLQGDVL